MSSNEKEQTLAEAVAWARLEAEFCSFKTSATGRAVDLVHVNGILTDILRLVEPDKSNT